MGKKRVKPASKKAGKCASKKQTGDKKPLPFTCVSSDKKLIFSVDFDSYFKSIWIGCLLITFVWQWNDGQRKPSDISCSWYG